MYWHPAQVISELKTVYRQGSLPGPCTLPIKAGFVALVTVSGLTSAVALPVF
jgi:hypothetical protein